MVKIKKKYSHELHKSEEWNRIDKLPLDILLQLASDECPVTGTIIPLPIVSSDLSRLVY